MGFGEPQHSVKALSAVWWLKTQVVRGPIPVARNLFNGHQLAKYDAIKVCLIIN